MKFKIFYALKYLFKRKGKYVKSSNEFNLKYAGNIEEYFQNSKLLVITIIASQD